MQDLKPYLVPGIALLVLGLWFLVISPKLSSGDTKAPESPASSGAPSTPNAQQ